MAALAFSRDGKMLASGGDDALVHLWDPANGTEIRQLKGHQQSVVSVLFSPDGRTLISGGLGKTIRVWNPGTGQETRQIACRPGDADALTLSPDGRILAAEGEHDNTLRAGRTLATGTGNRLRVMAIRRASPRWPWRPDGKQLASSSTVGRVRFWDTQRGKEVGHWSRQQTADAVLACSSDGKTLADRVRQPTAVKVVDAATGQKKLALAGPKDDPVLAVAFSPDGKMLGVSHRNGGIQLWSLPERKVAQQLPCPGGAQALAFAPDGKILAGAGTDKMALWDVVTGQQLHPFSKVNPVACLAFSPDGQTLASGMYDATIKLWDVRQGLELGKELRTLEGHGSAVFAIAFAADGRTLTSGSYDRTVRLWETASGNQIGAWGGHRGPVTGVALTPNGRVVISGSADTSLLFWDVTGRSTGDKLTPEKVAADQMEGLWQDLASEDVPRAHRALWTLVAGAAEVLPLLETQKRVFLVDPEHIQKLLRDLNDNKFATRERAHGELAKYGRWIEGVLDVARKNPPSEEVRRRVEKLLARLQVPGSLSLQQERLRARRLMEVLEQCATPARCKIFCRNWRVRPRKRIYAQTPRRR